MRLYCLAVGLVASIFMLRGCGSSGSGSGPSSFHYTQTTTWVDGGGTKVNHMEGWYKAPDSVRVVSDSATPFFEIVLLGSNAWVRDRTGWSEVDPESVRPLAMANVQSIVGVSVAEQALGDAGQGPLTAGEPTRRYRGSSNSGAENERKAIDELIARSSPECAQGLQELKQDLTTEVQQIEIVVGGNTNRLYSSVIDTTRRSSTVKTELTIDEYGAPVEIQPPASALPLKSSSSSAACRP